jgi:cytochrome c-type biogenesis protein CcsB
MTRRMVLVSGGAAALVVFAILSVVYRYRTSQPVASPALEARAAFAARLDLEPLGRISVYEDGRLKSFDSFASSMMFFVSGPHAISGNPDGVSYLDLMFNPEAYVDADIVYVKSKPMRGDIGQALRRSLVESLQTMASSGGLTPAQAAGREAEVFRTFDARMGRFAKTGLISAEMLLDSGVQDLLAVKERDLIRTASAVGQIRSALGVMQPEILRRHLRIVPPPAGGVDDPWITIDELDQRLASGAVPAGADADRAGQILAGWATLAGAWRNEDAAGVNVAAARIAELLPLVNAGLYPDQDRLAWETWYFQAKNMTWVWLVYLLSVVLLLMSIAYRWQPARVAGLAVFAIAFGLHTFALVLRWYVSGRWPNSNMFEAVTTSVGLGGCLAIFLELFVRRTAMRSLFALGSGVASMVALMCVHFLPVQLNANISNKMPVLHDVWLYIHTNVIIFSYALISMAAVSAGIYLVYRLGGGAADYVRVGGAGTLILKKPDGQSYLSESGSSPGQVFDGATMVLMELAFIMLWTGLVMGAIWADHSWGRPWGWDPKEVFALNTFIILALLVHVRLKVRDKGLWTALLAMAGFIVMLFNWIFINFVIVGLHSYA